MKKLTAFIFLLSFSIIAKAQNTYKIRECVIAKGDLIEVEVEYDYNTGEKTVTVNGQKKKFAEVYPPEGTGYAAASTWFINSETITVEGDKYVKYGLPRVLGVTDLQKRSTYLGVNIYVEPGLQGVAEMIYIPVRGGCEFQPYQREKPACDVKIVASDKKVKSGQTISFTAVSSGKNTLNYSWQLSNGQIISGEKSNKLTVSTKDVKGELYAFLTATAADGSCESYPDALVLIE
jgi:hypothetical protein